LIAFNSIFRQDEGIARILLKVLEYVEILEGMDWSFLASVGFGASSAEEVLADRLICGGGGVRGVGKRASNDKLFDFFF